MSKFLLRDKQAFEEYAVQVAVICLKQALSKEKFNLTIYQQGVPLTMSSVGRNYVFNEWRTNSQKYLPFQISGDCLMGKSYG